MPAVDEDTAAYILATRPAFEDLLQVSAQLAGLLVLAAAGSPAAGPHHPMLSSAAKLCEEAVEAVRQARVPPAARRQHRYLLAATRALQRAIRAGNAGIAMDPVLLPLRAAYARLQLASRELPGFPMVALEQGCCARKS